MKSIIITCALVFLGLGAAKAYDNREYLCGSQLSFDHDVYTKESFVERLALAPKGEDCGCGPLSLKQNTSAQIASTAQKVAMLGKVVYGFGKSYLSYENKRDIEREVLKARNHFGPNSLVVVFGYADPTGDKEANQKLSGIRAENVAKHINTLDWQYNLHLQTTTVAMGEKIEFCRHNMKHNRIAEIWLVEFPIPVMEVMKAIKSINEDERAQSQFIGRGPVVTFGGPAFCAQCRGVNPPSDNRAFKDATGDLDAFGEMYILDIIGLYPKKDTNLARAIAGVQHHNSILERFGPAGINAVFRRDWTSKELYELHEAADKARHQGAISRDNYDIVMSLGIGSKRASAGVWLNKATGENLYPFAGSGDSLFKYNESIHFIAQSKFHTNPNQMTAPIPAISVSEIHSAPVISNQVTTMIAPQLAAPVVSQPVAVQPAPFNSIEQIAQYLEQNIILAPGADRAEFSRLINTLMARQ